MNERYCIYEKELGMLMERTQSHERELQSTIKNDKEWKRCMSREVGELKETLATVLTQLENIANSKILRVQIWAALIMGGSGLIATVIGIWARR